MSTATPPVKNDVFAFEVGVKSVPDSGKTINARTAGKAKYQYLLELWDCYPDYTFADLRCRKLGPAHTSEGFRRNARYRGVPDVVCGQRVIVGEARGVIVGHNSSANFDVLFDDDSPEYAGETLNVHPQGVIYESDESPS